MFKRIGLFLLTNLAIIVVISILLSIFNVQPFLDAHGLNYQALMVYALIIGFTGAIISLLLSKFMAKYAFGVQLISQPKTREENFLFTTVESLAKELRIGMPEVGIYQSPEPNAFATGWNKNNALVCVSTGLLNSMEAEEIEGVIGHEMSHVANGDMVTLTLIQGVINTFVIFFARVAAFFVTQLFHRNSESSEPGTSNNFVYYGVAILFEILFGILATMIVMWFSRYREFRADAGSAALVGKEKMIRALKRLDSYSKLPSDNRAPAFAAMKISDNKKLLNLFASHPPIAARIEALEQTRSI